MKPSIVGLLFLAACVAGFASMVPEQQVNGPLWFFVYLALAASGLFAWSHPQAPSSGSGWLLYAVAALLAGGIFALLDFWLLGMAAQSLEQFTQQNPGIVLELGVSLLASFVALAGWARSLVLPKNDA
jgi:tryptophan-rich sensory protein